VVVLPASLDDVNNVLMNAAVVSGPKVGVGLGIEVAPDSMVTMTASSFSPVWAKAESASSPLASLFRVV
jgi:hypothetical protein